MGSQKEVKKEIKKGRSAKNDFFKNHPKSPLIEEEKNNFTGLNYFPIDLDYRFELDFHEYDNKEKLEVEDSKGNKQDFIRWGKFELEIHDQQVTLQAYKGDLEEEGLWVPFRDKTNGKETYGAGRYLDLAPQNEEDDKWVLDFNEAYNPFCAYNEDYICPLIPPENWIEVEIKAGEKKYH